MVQLLRLRSKIFFCKYGFVAESGMYCGTAVRNTISDMHSIIAVFTRNRRYVSYNRGMYHITAVCAK